MDMNIQAHPVYDAILKRRSIRRFKDEPVPRESVELLLKAAMAAPSACNLQPWAFIVVDEKEALEAVYEAAEEGRFSAPLAIVILGVYKHIPWEGDGWQFDCGLAAENMLLEATELGLASVTVGGFDEEKLRLALDIPNDVAPVCILEFGVADTYREPRTWYTDEAVYYQKYDAKKPRTMRTIEMLNEDIKAGVI